MKIIQINDCDWWIGESLAACVSDYKKNVDGDPAYTDDARGLTDEELDSLKFSICNEYEQSTGQKRTFREQLAIEVAEGGDFPRMFASTEQ
jgi:hypothetical protein